MTIKTKVAPTFKVGDIFKKPKPEPVTDVVENKITNTYEAEAPEDWKPWEEICVRHYVEDGLADKSAAYRKARAAMVSRWKDDTVWQKASRFFKLPKVERRLAELHEKTREKTEVTAEYVTSRVREVVERSMQAEPVYDREGNPVMVQLPTGEIAAAYAFQPMAALKGLDHLGKTIPKYFDGEKPMELNIPIFNVNFISAK